MKENKLDDIIRTTVNKDLLENPSSNFTESVMNKLGISPQDAKLKTKPITSKWGLGTMILIYVLVIGAVFLIPGSVNSGSFQLPSINIPSITQYFNFDENTSIILIMLIFSGWFLLFIDKFLKKLFIR